MLVQLPPSFVFEARPVRAFFGVLRETFDGGVVCEPRHASWFTANAERVRELRGWPAGTDVWCIFDNTASGAAIVNALELRAWLDPDASRPTPGGAAFT